jgi:hypothetical protein
MINWKGQERINALHLRFDRVASLLKCFRIASMAWDETIMDEDWCLPTDDQKGLSWTEREHVLLILEQELRGTCRELQRVLPKRDMLALMRQWDAYRETFTAQFGTPNGASVEDTQGC